jgi:hypothetical protein
VVGTVEDEVSGMAATIDKTQRHLVAEKSAK